MGLTIGKSYTVKHSRKGTFLGTLKSFDNEWATFIIVKGTAHTIGSWREPTTEGGEIDVRRSLAELTEFHETAKS